jgi:hypothetical protein
MKRLNGDVEGDIKENFSPDIIILSSFGTFHGHDGVRHSAAKLKDALGDATFSYNHTMIEGNYTFLEWTGSSKDTAVCDGADSFVVQDGLITMQTIHYSPEPKS